MGVRPATIINNFRPGQPIRITKDHKPGDVFALRPVKGVVRKLYLGEDRILRDINGGVYSSEDELNMLDTKDRTGVGLFSLPEGHWSEKATRAHDHQTSSTIYMQSNPRSKAEESLRERLKPIATTPGRRLVAKALTRISKTFSWIFWDSTSTRWK